MSTITEQEILWFALFFPMVVRFAVMLVIVTNSSAREENHTVSTAGAAVSKVGLVAVYVKVL
jgi:hypothetical protein